LNFLQSKLFDYGTALTRIPDKHAGREFTLFEYRTPICRQSGVQLPGLKFFSN
jgi:hypothetical protein